jgi:3-phosphoshikimate 1-carboxyvinyltransferase
LILAAFAASASGEECIVRNPLQSDDLTITLNALQTMGYEARIANETGSGYDVIFSGKRLAVQATPEEPARVYVHHSGTSARLLSAVAALQPFAVQIDGSPRMRERPMQELITPLTDLGANIQHTNGFLPLTMTKPITHGGRVRVNAEKSSQFLSALLLAAPLLEGSTEIIVEGDIASKSYSDMTIAQLREAGVDVHVNVRETATGSAITYTIAGSQHITQRVWDVEGDYSAASYPIAAAVIAGGSVTIPNLTQRSLQGDSAMLDIVRECGASVTWFDNAINAPSSSGVTIERKPDQPIFAINRDMNTCPDIVPTVAVLALFANDRSRLLNVAHLRYKESDRIHAIVSNIEAMGGCAFMDGDALIIEPRLAALHGAHIQTFDDHRIAMCFALAGLRVSGIQIENPACVAKSYPDFWRDFDALTQG